MTPKVLTLDNDTFLSDHPMQFYVNIFSFSSLHLSIFSLLFHLNDMYNTCMFCFFCFPFFLFFHPPQGGFWYGEGGGASALEAAMGQWGGDLIKPDSGSGLERDVAVLRDTETDDDSSAHGMLPLPLGNSENVTLGDGATAGGGGGRRRVARDNAAAATAGAGGVLVDAGVGEDESWEIVDAPGHWEEGFKVREGSKLDGWI